MPSSDGVALVTRQLAVQRVRHGLGALTHTHTQPAPIPLPISQPRLTWWWKRMICLETKWVKADNSASVGRRTHMYIGYTGTQSLRVQAYIHRAYCVPGGETPGAAAALSGSSLQSNGGLAAF